MGATVVHCICQRDLYNERVQFSYFTIIVFQPCSILNSTQLESEDGRDNSERGKYSIEDANHPRPSSSDGMSFENVIKDRDELEGFQKYLEKKDPKGSTCSFALACLWVLKVHSLF
jgi:hypothetical protein